MKYVETNLRFFIYFLSKNTQVYVPITYFAFSFDAHSETFFNLATRSVGYFFRHHGNTAGFARAAVKRAVLVDVFMQLMVEQVVCRQYGKCPLLAVRVETFALALSEVYREFRAILLWENISFVVLKLIAAYNGIIKFLVCCYFID